MLQSLRLQRNLLKSYKQFRSMASSSTTFAGLDLSVPVHRVEEGTRALDKNKFRKNVSVVGARIPAAKTSELMRSSALKRHLLELRSMSRVIPDGSKPESRILLLNAREPSEIPPDVSHYLEAAGASYVDHQIELTYDNWTADEILQAILPTELRKNAPSGFSIVGHIAHLNLNDEYLPYKYIIGQVILDKNPTIKTVINKLNTIHTEFRFFDMELIAGVPEYVVSHNELSCTFQFDFREVYWNSRLHAEHERLVRQFTPDGGVIVDVMAGVGPFSIPAAKRGLAVLANDLNPSCYKWHKINAEANKVTRNLRIFCEDGHSFIPASFKNIYHEAFPPYSGKPASNRQLRMGKKALRTGTGRETSPTTSIHATEKPRNRIGHFIMNLPDSAISFLGAFRGVLNSERRGLRGLYFEMPMVHCYCFTRFLETTEAEADIKKRVTEALGDSLEGEVSLHLVRSVAPGKDMYCISFRLPRRVAYADAEY